MLSAGLKKKIQECPPRSGIAPRGAVPLGIIPALQFDFGAPYIFKVLKELYPTIENQIKLSENQILTVISKLPYYYNLGYGFKDWPKFKDSLYKVLPTFPQMEIAKVLSFITGITKEENPKAFEWLVKKNKIESQIVAEQKQRKIDITKKNAYATQEIVDKLKRGSGAIQSTLKSGLNALKPYLILGALGYGGYYLYKKGAFKKREYVKNPIKKSKAEKAVEKYIEFHDRKPSKRIEIEPIETDELIYLGNALEIGYESKKWTGNNENYLHEFGKGVKVYQTLDGKSLVISGGKMRVKSQGITN